MVKSRHDSPESQGLGSSKSFTQLMVREVEGVSSGLGLTLVEVMAGHDGWWWYGGKEMPQYQGGCSIPSLLRQWDSQNPALSNSHFSRHVIIGVTSPGCKSNCLGLNVGPNSVCVCLIKFLHFSEMPPSHL